MTKAGAALVSAFLLPVFGIALTAQQAALTFEVASVKPNRSGSESFSAQTLPDRAIYTNYPLIYLVALAYQVRRESVSNASAWVAVERFDINAKLAESDTRGTPAEASARRRLMLQTLLEDRFRLVGREASVDTDVFALVLARRDGSLGQQLRRSTLTCGENITLPPLPRPEVRQPGDPILPGVKAECRVSGTGSAGRITGSGQPIDSLAGALLGVEGRRVVDKTALKGRYDFDLSFAPFKPFGPLVTTTLDDSTSNLPSVFVALQEQLGLKLQPDKVTERAIHIERIERPTPD